MPSVHIPLPPLEDITSFISKYNSSYANIFKLSWALILNAYFDTVVFLIKGDGSENGHAFEAEQLMTFIPELAKKALAVDELLLTLAQRADTDRVLLSGKAADFDSSLQNLWSCVRITEHGSSTAQDTDGGKEFDIVIDVSMHEASLTATLLFGHKLSETRDFTDIARALGQCLSSIVSIGAEATVADIDLISEYDISTILSYNAQTPFAVEKCLHHLISETVSATPDQQAILAWNGSLTYLELDEMSSKLSHHLIQTFDLGPEQIVPLLFEKSTWAVITMLAVLKSGAAYCCFDPAHPQVRRDYMLELVDAKVVLCSAVHVALVGTCSALVIDAEFFDSIKTPSSAPETDVKPHNACVVAFTSGTTGYPKAILHTHTSVTSGLLANAPHQDINRRSIRLFQWAAYTFDVSITETFGPLIYGGLVCIPSEEERLNNIEECMKRMEVDWAYFTPTFARFFRRYTIPSLKQLTLGGEAVTMDDVRAWADRVRVINAYGPAESITWFMEPQLGLSSTISIGRPVNVRAWIVKPDDHDCLVPVGAIGELLLEGTSLLRGYIKNKEKTDQSLISPPSWHKKRVTDGMKMYKTGDLVRYLPDGTMTYMGRKDTMIKVYGQRMELEEVESILRRNLHELAESSADVIRPAGEKEEPVLVVFICLKKVPNAPHLREVKPSLQRKLRDALPAFMVPNIYIPVDEMPYNTSRKLDRSKLRQSISKLTRVELIKLLGREEIKREPRTSADSREFKPFEKLLHSLWVNALNLNPEQIGLDDNFFALGGSSITVLKVTATGKNEGVDISYREMFRYPTIRQLAQIISRTSKETDAPLRPFSLLRDAVKERVLSDAIDQCNVPADLIEDVYPIAPQQQGLWAVSLIRDGDYVAQFVLTLKPEIDISKFREVWESIIDMLPIFRTRFIQSPSGSYQVVLKVDVQWQFGSDINDYLAEDIKTEVSFGAPIVRHAIFPANNDNKEGPKIVLTMHHALFDGESVPMFLNAVARAYDGNFPSPQVGSFNKFIGYLDNQDESEACKYWRAQFSKDAPVVYPALPQPEYRPSPSAVYKKHIQFARRGNSSITTATLLRAALTLALTKITKSWNTVLGVTLAGRSAPVSSIENLIGPTFVTLPTRGHDGAEDSVHQYLTTFQSSIIDMMPFEHTGMQKISSLGDKCWQACQFQTICLVQTPDDQSFTKCFEFDDSIGGVGRFNSHSLMILLFTNPFGVDTVVSYDENVINREGVARVMYSFESLIHILCLEEKSRSIRSIFSSTEGKFDKFRLSSSSDEYRTNHSEEATGNSNLLLNHSIHLDLPTSSSLAQELETLIGRIWVEILGMPSETIVNSDDEFVRDFGGNSLLSLRLAHACREEGISLLVKDIFRYPKLSDMARAATRIATQKPNYLPNTPFSLIDSPLQNESTQAQRHLLIRTEAAKACNVSIEKISDIYPSTPLQEGLLALSVTQPGAYISRTVYELSNGIDVGRFCNAWNEVYREVEILRTRLFQPPDLLKTYQVVLVENTITWKKFTNVAECMDESERISMSFGTALSDFSIVRNPSTNKVHFVLTIHHALYDGWSMHLLMERVYQIYFDQSRSSMTPFSLFVHSTTTEMPKDTEAYWKAQFGESDYKHFPRPLVRPDKVGKQIDFHASLLTPKATNSSILKSTLFRAGWALLLSKYTNTKDVIFGATLSGRNIPLTGIEMVIGPTLATVPIRISIDRNEDKEDFLKRVQDHAADMISYEQTGMQTIRNVDPEASNFQNLLVLQPRSSSRDYSKLWVSQQAGDSSKFMTYPLLVQCTFDDNDITSVTATFDESRFSRDQVKRILHQYQQVLTQLASPDSTTVGLLELVGLEDRVGLNSLVQNADTGRAVHRFLHHQVLDQALIAPDQIAVTSSEDQLTYEELMNFSNQLAQRLQDDGIGPGSFVPIVFDKSIWAVVAMLSVLISGAAFVPIDPNFPAHRRNFITKSVDASLVLAAPNYTELFEETNVFGVDRITITALPIGSAGKISRTAPETLSTNLPAYILFTSGSTGTPKGVVVSHLALSSSTRAHGKFMGFDSQTRALQFCSFTFDVSLAEIFTTLVFGGTVCFPSSWGRLNDLGNEIRKLRVNWSFLTPSVARLIDPNEVPGLKILVLGGEDVQSSEVARWTKTNIRLINGYGPTEACIFCVTRDIRSAKSAKSIGRPVGCNCFIVDPMDHNKLAPIGTIGELLVTGPILADGYLNDKTRTEAVFIEAPAWSKWFPEAMISPNQVFYKTGDLVRYNDIGDIEYISRKDLQVKIRGLRIEIEDVEHWIQSDSRIKHAIVIPLTQNESNHQLLAIYSLRDTKAQETPEVLNGQRVSRYQKHSTKLKEILIRHLPAYAVPNAWICMEEIPLSSAGKVNRRAITDWASNISQERLRDAVLLFEADRKPAGDLEELIRDVWSSVLSVKAEYLSANRSFLSYGGDSISVIHVVKELRKELIIVSTAEVLLANGISDLATLIRSRTRESNDVKLRTRSFPDITNFEDITRYLSSAKSDIKAGDVLKIMHATPTQEKMIQKLERGFYNVKMLFKIWSVSALDMDRLQKAWLEVAKRHESLRTVFVKSSQRGGYHEQVILKSVEPYVNEIVAVDEKATLYINSTISPHLTQAKDQPPYRLTVQTTERSESLLKLEVSHAVTDAVSLGIVFKEFALAYDGRLLDQYVPQFADYHAFLWEHAETDQSYWEAYCEAAAPNTLPMLLNQTFNEERLCQTGVQFPNASTIIQFCKEYGVSVANLFHAVWTLTLKSYATGSKEVVFGYLVSGRDTEIEGVDEIVGPMVSILIQRNRSLDTSSLVSLLLECRDDTIRGSARKYCDMSRIEKTLGLAGRLCNTAINFRKYPKQGSDSTTSIRFEYLEGFDPWEYELMLIVDEADSDWKVELAFHSSAFETSEVLKMAARFSEFIDFVIEHPQQTIGAALEHVAAQ